MSRKIITGLLALGCAAALASTSFAASFRNVDVKDDSFSRTHLSISRGTTVVWHWKDTQAPHNVTAYKTPKGVSHFQSHTVAGNYTYKHRFAKKGTFLLHCTIHSDMQERITVH
jgi:plastocyanin